MALSRFIAEKFGTKTRAIINPLTDTVAVAITNVLSNNPDRLAFILINLGAENLYLAPDREVSATRGIFVQSGGGSLSMFYGEDFELVGYDFYAVVPANTTTIFILEVEAE